MYKNISVEKSCKHIKEQMQFTNKQKINEIKYQKNYHQIWKKT